MNRNFTIALLIDWIENSYHLSLLNGASECAEKNNINLLSFVGGAVNSNRIYEIPRNLIYEYANKRNVDGIIMLSGSVGHYCSSAELDSYIEKFYPLPVISISQKLENAFSILIDNKTGLRALINHLIKDHGYKKIAFINGPDGNQEAILRFEIYQETLKENGIDYNEDYVAGGLFTIESGKEAVRVLLDERKLKIDALVAGNDDMAFGAIKELQGRNIIIPNDIAVTGFDDQQTSQFTMPAITTVRQNLFNQGYKSVEMILDRLNGREVPKTIILPTEAVIRESCGCLVKPELNYTVDKANNDDVLIIPDEDDNNIIKKITDELDVYLKNNPLFELLKNELKNIVTHFINAVKQNNVNLIFNTIQNMLFKYQGVPEALSDDMIKFLNICKNLYLKYLGKKYTYIILEYIDFIKLYVSQYIFKKINYNKLKEDNSVLIFRDVGEELVAYLTMDEIIKLFVREFPALDINACFFSLYEKPFEGTIDLNKSVSRMILAYNKNNLEIKDDEILFDSMDLVQKKLLSNIDRWSLVVEPMFFGNTQLGIALLDFNPKKSFTYNIMRRMFIFNVLKNAIYVQKILSQSRYLEDTLNELKETQAKLIQSEKMSALGGLVAGISHEINTPIGISVTAASHLEKITQEMFDLFSEQKMKKSDFEKYVNNAKEASMMILSNLKRAHELISSFKQVAVDQSNEEKRKFNVKEYLNQILLSLQPKLRKTNQTIDVKCSDDFEITTYPGAFSQIVTNLIMNSLLHAFDDDKNGLISIDIDIEKKNLVLIYKDNGKGMDTGIVEKIFDPFFTTKRGQGGTGLGLNIVYNIVNQTLKGTIKCVSSPGKGAVFTVIFPINSHEK